MSDVFEELWSLEYRVCGDQQRAKAWARELLDRHAHELAEKIRNAPMAVGFEDGAWDAADLIDPEVQP